MALRLETNLESAWKAWKEHPDDERLSGLLDTAKPVMTSAIRTYAGGRTDPVIELETKRLMINAFDNYDKTKGAKLQTYLLSQLQPIRRVAHQRGQELKMPQQAWADLQNIKRADDDYKEKHGSTASAGELADLTGLSLKRIGYLRKFRKAGVPESILREANKESYFAPGVDDKTSSFWAEAVYHGLDPRDQKIFDTRLGTHGEDKLSNKDIAKLLGISESAISQRVSYIIGRLEEGVT
jgi:DNA-directed RNA polymerase specialized sigma subunit